MKPITRLDLERAYARTASYRSNTPLMPVPFLSKLWQAEVYMKCEQFQAIGAFKIRGASNFVAQLSSDQLRLGLVTHSSGNHAQAVAYMAYKKGVKATIVMPENASDIKRMLAKKWGAEVVDCAPTIESRIAKAEEVQADSGAIMVPPFDHPWIVEGQATAAMEVFRSGVEPDVVVAPLGGGGLLAGTALAAHCFSPATKVWGAEPEAAADGYRGFYAGVRETTVEAKTVADGLRTTVGAVPFQYICEHVEAIFLAKEETILPWMHRLWSETKVLLEPSSAVPFAALDAQRDKLKGKTVVIVITGGNVDFTQLS